MRAYSEELRKKIVAALERGMSKAEAARTFSVSLSSVKRYARRVRHGESLTPKKSPGRPRISRPKSPSPPKGGCNGAPGRHHRSKTSLPKLPKAHNRNGHERLHRKAPYEEAWLLQKNGHSGGAGTRRVLKMCLESDGRRASRDRAAALRRRDGHEHLFFVFCVRLGTERPEGLLVCTSQPRS